MSQFPTDLRTPRLLEEFKRLKDDRGGLFAEVVLREVLAADPASIQHVGTRFEAAAPSPADIIDDDIMIADARPIPGDAVENRKDFEGLDVQSSFFLKLTAYTLGHLLAEFKQTPRNRPGAFERLAAPPNQQDSVPVNHHPAHTCNRMIRIFPFHLGPLARPVRYEVNQAGIIEFETCRSI